MPIIPNNVDWSATAAWIALIVSIVGTIVGPIATAIISNRHQYKMLCLKQKQQEYEHRQVLIRDCISGISAFLARPNTEKMHEFGKTFCYCYAYVSKDNWPLLDDFYSCIISLNYAAAKTKRDEVIHLLAELLKEPPQ